MEDRRIPVTREGFERLKEELHHLREVRRPQIVAAVAEARSHGDLRENAAYDAARHDQMMMERRITELEQTIRNADVLDDDSAGRTDVVGFGSTVVVDFDGFEETFTIVGAVEAKPSAGKISTESPIGRALIGKRVGQKTQVPTPGGMSTIKILRIE
jgi:transcription elongation factor GreA